MRFGLTALAMFSACAALCGQARADVIYAFTTTEATNTNESRTLPVTLTYDLSSTVVQSDSFTLSSVGGNDSGPSNGGFPPTFTGDASGFTYLRFQTGEPGQNDLDVEYVAPDYLYGEVKTTLTFNALGDVTSSFVDFLGVSTETHLSGTGDTASGYGASDANVCFGGNPSNACSVTGVWTHTPFPYPAPEPASLALLAAGLIGLGAGRRATIASAKEGSSVA